MTPSATPAGRLPDAAAPLVDRIRAGDRRALARAISWIENGDSRGREVVAAMYPASGHASLVGLTGPPGVGKSSLTAALIAHIKAQESHPQIGVVSVDPSSPFTHGAVLGDRIRLSEHFLDEDVFIRSMGTRGKLGGVAAATLQVALLLDAAGRQELFVETVGVGQSEIEIASIADTVLLVLMPGSGDAVQALKAGIMEIPDIIVINKADHPNTRTLRQQVQSVLLLNRERDWMPPIIQTQATTGDGVDELWSEVLRHRSYLADSGRLSERRRQRLEREVFSLVTGRAQAAVRQRVAGDSRLGAAVERVHRRELDPMACADLLFAEVFGQDDRVVREDR